MYLDFFFCLLHVLVQLNISQDQPIIFLLLLHLNMLVSLPLLKIHLCIMASTPPSSKRMKADAVKRGGHLENWFSGDDGKIEKFLHESSRKAINNPKLITLNWLKGKNLNDVRNVLKEQQLKRFLEMSGNIYPDLVKVFYTNLHIDGENLCSHVKSVDMEITPDVWTAVIGLKYAGLRIKKWNIGVVEEFNKMRYYRSCLKNPHSKAKGFSVGGLKLNERIIAFIVSCMLTLRGSNHSVLTEEDLVLIYCIMKKIKVNWIHIFKEHIQKSTRLSDYHFPYVVLISKLLHYFEIDLEEELFEVVKPSHEVNNRSLSKMRFIKVEGKWVSKDGEQGCSSSGNEADAEEDHQNTILQKLESCLEQNPVDYAKQPVEKVYNMMNFPNNGRFLEIFLWTTSLDKLIRKCLLETLSQIIANT